ncbi:hypothetical protein ACOMHN_060427 [Nucella lapillus]
MCIEHCLSGPARVEVSSKRRADELSVKKLATDQMKKAATSGSCPEKATASASGGQPGAGNSMRNTDSGSRPTQKTSSTAKSEAKVPKWLKIGKK